MWKGVYGGLSKECPQMVTFIIILKYYFMFWLIVRIKQSTSFLSLWLVSSKHSTQNICTNTPFANYNLRFTCIISDGTETLILGYVQLRQNCKQQIYDIYSIVTEKIVLSVPTHITYDIMYNLIIWIGNAYVVVA